MRRLVAGDYAVDAVTAAKALVGAWLCRRLEDGTVIRRRITETEAYCGGHGLPCAQGARVADGRDVLALPTPRGATSRGSGVSHFAANNGFAGHC